MAWYLSKLRPPALPCPLHLWRRQCGRRPGLKWSHRATNGRERTGQPRRRRLPSPVAVSGTLPCIEDTEKTPRPSLRCGTDLGKFRRRGCHSADVTPAPGSSRGAEGRRRRRRTPAGPGSGRASDVITHGARSANCRLAK